MSGGANPVGPPAVAPIAQQRIGDFLAALAARTPTPGGGAVAGSTLATAAALGRMVLAFTIGKPRFAEHAATHQDAERRLADWQVALLDLADADATAYHALNAAQRLPSDAPGRNALPALLIAATEPPLRMAEAAHDMQALLEGLRANTNPHLGSDLAIAIDLARCGRRAALHNVHANLPLVDERSRGGLAARAARVSDATE